MAPTSSDNLTKGTLVMVEAGDFIPLDGEVVETYHYSATYEFPYFMGCFRGATA